MTTTGHAPAAIRPGRLPAAVPVAIGSAWLTAALAEVTGGADRFGHDALLAADPAAGGLLTFVLAWQVMVVAMMLPSAIPLIRLFSGVAAGVQADGGTVRVGREPRRAVRALIGGYLALWGVIGLIAFLGDGVVHAAVDAVPAVGTRQRLEGGVLALAGIFQFTTLKDRCLARCRHPAAYLLPRYRRGVDAAFRLGVAHGWFCVGCCWALMLLMFAVGMADLRWMAALAALMVYEKVGRHGVAAGRSAGAALVVIAAVRFVG